MLGGRDEADGSLAPAAVMLCSSFSYCRSLSSTSEYKAASETMIQNALQPDLTVRDLNDWAKMQSERLRLGLGNDTSSQPAFVLAQAVQLTEDLGELQAEVLGQAGYQRASKDQRFTTESMPHVTDLLKWLLDRALTWGVREAFA